MKFPAAFSLFALLSVSRADIIIDAATNNGGFTSQNTGFNGSPAGWTASAGVWLDSGNSPLTSAPFGPDTTADSRFIQIHNNAGETLTSNAAFSVGEGESIELSLDYKTGGTGADTTLTITLWDAAANATYATLGSLHTASAPGSFTQIDFSATAHAANDNLRLRFTLGPGARDIHIDRVHLSGGVLVPEPEPEPIEYATLQHLLPGDSDERIVEKAAKLLPRPNQVEWQRMETTFFIHYGPNAFTGVEWGTGKESPSVFNPTALDAAQWVREIRNAGGKMLMLVVKHHDGFCLWPSRYTEHDVASSPWLGGHGDLARLVADECAAQGLKFGVYLSPADLFQIESPAGYYGNGSTSRLSAIPTAPQDFSTNPAAGRTPPAGMPVLEYAVDDYNRYFLNQLYELLTEYGPIAEVWFDGATPKQTNPPQLYDRPAWYHLIRTLRPEAVIAIKGPDVRWVGNESGISRETEWSPLPVPLHPDQYTWNDMTAQDLGSRARLTRGSHLTWYPAEADVPILHGWFWAPGKSVRTATQLIDIHYASVGRNSNLLLNLSPDNRGLIPDNQLAPLRAMSQVIGQTFATDLAAGASGTSDSAAGAHPSALALDGNLDTWWEPSPGQHTGTFTLTLPEPKTFDVVSLQEAIAQRGQRIESFAIDTWQSGAWAQRATATTIGHKRLIRLAAPVTSDRLRLRILQSRLEPTLAEISLHKQADMVAEPSISRDTAGSVSLSAAPGESIRYTLDGSEPDAVSALYHAPFDLLPGGTVRAVAFRTNGSHSLPATRTFGIAPAGWTATASGADSSFPASHAIDGNAATRWHATGGHSHRLTIDMGSPRWIGGFAYLPRQDGNGLGIVKDYRLETSADGEHWTTAAEGTFDNIRNNPVEQTISFPQAVHARWLRLVSLAEIEDRDAASAAEISVLPGGFDAWKVHYGYQNEPHDADPDGDGWSIRQEYAFGGDPRRADSGNPARFEWHGDSPRGGLRIERFTGIPDIDYRLLAAESPAGPWEPVEALIETTDVGNGRESVAFIELDPPAAPRRFYRLAYSLAP